MNLDTLLENVFGEIEVTLFDSESDETVVITPDSINPDAADAAVASFTQPCIDLMTEEGAYALAVWGDLKTATFQLRKDDKILSVYCMFDPVPSEVLDDSQYDDFLTEIPANWEYTRVSGDFATADNILTTVELDDAIPDFDEPTSVSDDDSDQPTSVEDSDEVSDSTAEQETGDDGASAPDTPSLINDATIVGVEHPDMAALFDKEVSYMTGQLYDQGDRRNTQKGGWQLNTHPWSVLLAHEKSPLTNHPVGKTKQGASIVIGETIDGERTANAVKSLGAIVIDIDSGPTIESVIAKLEELGHFALVYSSFNHKKTSITLKHDDVVKKLRIDETPNRAQVLEYLRTHHKDRYEPDFLEEITVDDFRYHGPNGLQILCTTPPLHKLRIILPLWEPAMLADIGTTATQWKENWANIVTGYVVNELGVSFDSTSCDVNRLFYLPRHPKGSDWTSTLVLGRPVRYDEIEPYSKSAYVKDRGEMDPFTVGETREDDRPPQCVAPSGMVLNAWHSKAKSRFMITDLLETECPDKVRNSVSDGKIEIECPFEHEHSSEGGTGTVVMSPFTNENEVWTISCPHDACQGRHKLEHLEAMLKDGWFNEELLRDDEYILPAEDDEEEEEAGPETGEDGEPKKKRTLVEMAEDLPAGIDDDAVVAFLKRAYKMGVSASQRNLITDIIVGKTPLMKSDVTKMWKDVSKEVAREKPAEDENLADFTGVPVINQWDFGDMCEYARRRIADINEKTPFMFHYLEQIARITENSQGTPRISLLNQLQFGAELNRISRWEMISYAGDNEVKRGVPAEKSVVQQLYNSTYNAAYPPLRGLINTPAFVRGGELVSTPGYHTGSSLYYYADLSLDIPKINMAPTEEEVRDAVDLLVDLIADFPLAGMKRTDIEEQAVSEEGIPAVAHCIAMILLLFCRDMIPGPTPGHLITKPAPGTGASLLTDVCSSIFMGHPCPAASLPGSNEEMQKTLSSFLANGSPIIYFDNINQSVDSGELASCMTAPLYKARKLGTNDEILTEVRCAFIFTGNNVQLSNEILRRLVMIDLDAQMAKPDTRTDYKHEDIMSYARDNRGLLVHACLTLIQNWINKGKPLFSGTALNSFENWSSIMGGILESAGLNGFLGNREELKDIASDDSDEDIIPLLDSWWEAYGEKDAVVKVNKDVPSLTDIVITNEIQLPIRMKMTVDGDRTFDGQAFGRFLKQNRGRVFSLTTGEEVAIESKTARHRHGTIWHLVEKNID